MRWSECILPAVALVAVVSWNVATRCSVGEARQENRELSARIGQAARAVEAADRGGADSRRVSRRVKKGEDWEAVASQLVTLQERGSAADLRRLADLEERVGGMSVTDLEAALEEVAGLGLDDEARAALEEMLIGPLIEKDPALVLDKFKDRIGNADDSIGWQLGLAMAGWAERDLPAATAWLDRQIAAGLFEIKSLDGRSDARLEFEAAVLARLLGADPAAAGLRIQALPEDQRREALEQISISELGTAARVDYARLVRELVPEDERAGSFAHVVDELAGAGGYDEVGAFLDAVSATSEERRVSAGQAGQARLSEIAGERLVTREDVEAMRAWVGKQAGGEVDRVTGEALGEAAQDGGEFDFGAASALALEYHDKSGTDDVLISFLESFAARSNVDQARQLIGRIRDESKRREMLEAYE